MAGVKGRSGGHNRLPDGVKVLKGTFRKDRSNPHSPEAEPKIPRVSSILPEEARKEYRKLAKLLKERHVVTEADRGALENLAICRAQIRYMSNELFQQTDIKEFRKLQLCVNDAIKLCNALEAKFGLTPSDRGRVNVIPVAKKSNKWEDLDEYSQF